MNQRRFFSACATDDTANGVPCPRLCVGMLEYCRRMATPSSGHGTRRLMRNSTFNSFVMLAMVAATPTLAFAATDAAPSLQTETSDGPVKVTAHINTASARVAEPVQLVLQVDAPRGARIELPAKADRLGPFEVRRSERTMDIPS